MTINYLSTVQVGDIHVFTQVIKYKHNDCIYHM